MAKGPPGAWLEKSLGTPEQELKSKWRRGRARNKLDSQLSPVVEARVAMQYGSSQASYAIPFWLVCNHVWFSGF